MYRVPVINFIDKIDKTIEIEILNENTHKIIDRVRGGDNREYKLENLEEWYVARVITISNQLIILQAYQYPKN